MSATNPRMRTTASTFPNPGARITPPALLTDGGMWRRNPTWPALPTVTSSDQRAVGLYAVYPGGANFWAATCAAAWAVDYGDGSTATAASGGTLYKQFDYTDVDLVGTDGPVTLNGTADTVERTAHGYVNGNPISLYNIVTTTGVTEGQVYYVVNATANDFQVASTPGGSAIGLTSNGSATLLPYRIAVVDITPQSGQNLTSVNLAVKHNQSGLVNGYSSGYLDLTISVPNATTTGLTIGASTAAVPRHRNLERCNILTIGGLTSTSGMFFECRSLQSVSLFNTVSVTNMSSMFSGCVSLQSVPLFNTVAVTNMANMFDECRSLQSVPLFNTVAVTSMASMFLNCRSLRGVPLFNTASVTTMASTFQGCLALESVPLLNTAAVTSALRMFQDCGSLRQVPLFNLGACLNTQIMFLNCHALPSVPLFNTASVTNFSEMFSGCSALQSVPLLNTAAGTNMLGMFGNCRALSAVPLFSTASVTNASTMFSGCTNLAVVPALNFGAVSSATNLNNAFQTCTSLQKMSATGIAYTFSIASASLSAAELDAIYTNLATVVGQTITVTGNFGTAGDDPTIATNKGWTVTS